MERGSDKVQRLEKELASLLDQTVGSDHVEITRDPTSLYRYLRARDWDVKAALDMIQDSILWRQRERPDQWTCEWCREKTGYHAMRQVGHDALGRAVFYSSFIQMTLTASSACAEDSIAHVVYLLEQAIRSMATIPNGSDSCVWVMDCTGMFLAACSPRVAYRVNQILARHYPERLARILCVNSGYMMRGAFAAIKHFLAPRTAAKMRFMPVPVTGESLLDEHMGDEMTEWLMEEIRLNARRTIGDSQLRFWERPAATESVHDPRGSDGYVKQFIATYRGSLRDGDPKGVHHPHPNIIEAVTACK